MSLEDRIKSMSLQEVVNFRRTISVSKAKKNIKDRLYEACDKREKAVNLSTALVVQCNEM